MWASPAALLALAVALRAPQASGGFLSKIDLKGIEHAVHDAGKALNGHADTIVEAVKGSNPEKAAVDVLKGAPKRAAGEVVRAAEQGAEVVAARSDAVQDGAEQVLQGAEALQTALGGQDGVHDIGRAIGHTAENEKKVEKIVTVVERVDADKLLEAADSVNWLQHSWQRLAAAAGGLLVALLALCWAVVRCAGRHRRNREAVSAMIDAEISMYLNPGGGADARVFTRF